jgi:anthranilate phosphoribosyltransferase
MKRGQLKDIKVTTSMQSAQLIRQIFQNKSTDSAKNIVALNAGAALYVSGICSSFGSGVRQAVHLIESKTAYQMLSDLQKEGVSEHVN